MTPVGKSARLVVPSYLLPILQSSLVTLSEREHPMSAGHISQEDFPGSKAIDETGVGEMQAEGAWV